MNNVYGGGDTNFNQDVMYFLFPKYRDCAILMSTFF